MHVETKRLSTIRFQLLVIQQTPAPARYDRKDRIERQMEEFRYNVCATFTLFLQIEPKTLENFTRKAKNLAWSHKMTGRTLIAQNWADEVLSMEFWHGKVWLCLRHKYVGSQTTQFQESEKMTDRGLRRL